MKIKTIPADWCSWFCLVESKRASVTVDCNAHTDSNKSLESLVIVILNKLGTERNGFPTQEIFDDIYHVEEKIEMIANKNKSCYSGRFITDGKGYYLIYTNDPKIIKTKIEKMLDEETNLPFEISIRGDKEWKNYYAMLYPPKSERQKYLNTLLLSRITQMGDNSEKEHLIEHALFFDTKEDRDTYLQELRKLEFPFEKFEFIDHTHMDNPFTLILLVSSPLQKPLLDDMTNILITLAEKHHALYDGWGSEIEK